MTKKNSLFEIELKALQIKHRVYFFFFCALFFLTVLYLIHLTTLGYARFEEYFPFAILVVLMAVVFYLFEQSNEYQSKIEMLNYIQNKTRR